jgi:lipopolysaccharide-induced tumor necrosis factor-alpha factor
MIRYTCPSCQAVLSSPPGSEGTTQACSECGQRLEVPYPQEAPRVESVRNRPEPPARRRPEEEERRPARDDEERRPRRDNYDEDDREGRRSARRRGQFECPYCHTTYPPVTRSQISTAGWIVFVILLLFCLPLCFIGLFIKEEYRVCSECGNRIGA